MSVQDGARASGSSSPPCRTRRRRAEAIRGATIIRGIERSRQADSSLERGSGIPLYLQVRDAIIALIEERQLRPGDAIPSETDLQARFGVSRATVRQTLELLEREGRVERHQGKGTFVAVPRLKRDLPDLTSFTEHLEDQGLRAASELVAYERLEPGVMPSTRISDDEPPLDKFGPQTSLVRLVRLRLANDVPVGIHTTILPADVADRVGLSEELVRRDRSLSLYELLEAGGEAPNWAEEHLDARGANRAEARLLDVRTGTPVMSVLRLTRNQQGRLIEAVRAVYLGNKYDYVVELQRRVTRSPRRR